MRFYIKTIALMALIGALFVVSVKYFSVRSEATALRQELAQAREASVSRSLLVKEARILEKALAQRERVKKVTVTAYNPTEDQCDEDPYVAASMRRVRSGTIAVSRDLFQQGWVFGRKVRIKGMGIFEINDLMNKRFSNRIDVFMWDRDRAVAFGKRRIEAALLDI
jgi:3D (Asp-Asp-Asp) domain-containing protein